MMSKNNSTAVVHQNGATAFLQSQNESDAPSLPVKDIKTLQECRPDAVDLILEQTVHEAEYRRSMEKEYLKCISIERRIGQIFALIMGLTGIISGTVCILHGSEKAGTILASLAIATLALAFIGRKSEK